MSMVTLLVILAALCVVGSLAFGIAAMARHGEIGHRTSAQWMTMRGDLSGGGAGADPDGGVDRLSRMVPAQCEVPSDRLILFHTLYLPTGLFIFRRLTSLKVTAS